MNKIDSVSGCLVIYIKIIFSLERLSRVFIIALIGRFQAHYLSKASGMDIKASNDGELSFFVKQGDIYVVCNRGNDGLSNIFLGNTHHGFI